MIQILISQDFEEKKASSKQAIGAGGGIWTLATIAGQGFFDCNDGTGKAVEHHT